MNEIREITEDLFYAVYQPLVAPDETNFFQHNELPAFYKTTAGIKHVWSVVEGDASDTLYAIPGYHIVNLIAYMLTKQPWEDELISVELD